MVTLDKKLATLALGVVAAFLSIAPIQVFAVTIIDDSTFGFYNAGLGDLAFDSGIGDPGHFPGPGSSEGDPLLPSITEPALAGADPGTITALGDFLGNTTALGGSWSGSAVSVPGTWTVNHETAIVYEINAGTGLTDFVIDIGVDNGVYIWFDGVYQLGAMAPGGAFAGEYTVNIGSVSGGTHFLQIIREDHGGGTGWTIMATATESSVPEPATLALLGLGLVGLGFARRRLH